MNYIKKGIRRVFIKVFARKIFQKLFKYLHWVALRGMNYAGGYSPYDSGEIFILKYINNRLHNPIVIFDVGANTGQYASLSNKILGDKCEIYSFEPVSSTFRELQKKTFNKKNIQTFNIGFGSENLQKKIFFDGPLSVHSSIIDRQYSTNSELVNIQTIVNFCTENKISKINLLKIDVEGFEYEVLLGASSIFNDIDYIQFEFGNKQISNRNFLKDFEDLLEQFIIYRILQDGFIQIEAKPINEIFQTSNYFAINKRLL